MTKRGRPRSKGGDAVEQYALDVVRGATVAGPWVRGACERHLRDLAEQRQRGLTWDSAAAAEVQEFFEVCLWHGEGAFAGQRFQLMPWQRFVLGSLYGWRDASGHRRFRTAYICTSKGTGKTPLLSGLALYELMTGPRGSELFSAATGRHQARIVFRRAELMLKAAPSSIVSRMIKSNVDVLSCRSSFSSFRPVSKEAGTLEGHNVQLALIDEIHEHKNSDVCDVMQDGTKGRPGAMVVEITNTGRGTENVCWDHHRLSQRIVEGMHDDDRWFSYVCALDEEDDWRDKRHWIKANPSLGTTVTEDFLIDQVRLAEGMPSRERRVKRLQFCIWDANASDPEITAETWLANAGDVPALELREQCEGRECWAGLDLAAVNDLTALVLVFPSDDRVYDVVPFFWLPEGRLAEKERKDRAPYQLWRDQGYLETTPGDTIDDWYVARRIAQILEAYDVQQVAYDRWGMEKFKATARAVEVDLPDELLVPFGQGYQSMGPAINELERLLKSTRIRHGKHPLLNMCASHAVCMRDPADNRKWAKNKSEQRIDGVVALTMAVGLYVADMRDPEPEYQVLIM